MAATGLGLDIEVFDELFEESGLCPKIPPSNGNISNEQVSEDLKLLAEYFDDGQLQELNCDDLRVLRIDLETYTRSEARRLKLMGLAELVEITPPNGTNLHGTSIAESEEGSLEDSAHNSDSNSDFPLREEEAKCKLEEGTSGELRIVERPGGAAPNKNDATTVKREVVATFGPVILRILPNLIEEDKESDWRMEAKCIDADPEAFFPEKGGSTREAKEICARCPVRDECLDYALVNDERFGIWGGLSERERRKLRRGSIPREFAA